MKYAPFKHMTQVYAEGVHGSRQGAIGTNLFEFYFLIDHFGLFPCWNCFSAK